MMLFCRHPIQAPIRRVARLADMQVAREQPSALLLIEVEAQMRTMMPLMRAGLLVQARDTAEHAAASLVSLSAKISREGALP